MSKVPLTQTDPCLHKAQLKKKIVQDVCSSHLVPLTAGKLFLKIKQNWGVTVKV